MSSLGLRNVPDHLRQLFCLLRAIAVGNIHSLGFRPANPLPVQPGQGLHSPFSATHLIEHRNMPTRLPEATASSWSMVPSVAVTRTAAPYGGETSGHPL